MIWDELVGTRFGIRWLKVLSHQTIWQFWEQLRHNYECQFIHELSPSCKFVNGTNVPQVGWGDIPFLQTVQDTDNQFLDVFDINAGNTFSFSINCFLLSGRE